MHTHTQRTTTIFALAAALLLLLLPLPSALGQVVSPFATHDCSGALFYNGDHYCNNNPSTCCAFSGLCCAGGCCPELATCVFQGTANEACCSLSDSTLCGSVQPVSSKTCPNPAGPSVPCSGVDSTWDCAHGCTCDDSRDKGCNCFGGGGSGSCSGSGGGDSSSAPAAAPTSTDTAPVDSSSSSEDLSSSTPAAAASSSSGSAATTSVAGGVSVPSTTGAGSPTSASSAAAVTTTKASAAALRVQAAWAVGMGVLLVGVIVLL